MRVSLFLCGDVMTGRGIDQVLAHPSPPRIYEPYMTSALGYVELAEEKSGRIGQPVGFDYVWGDALGEMETRAPDSRIVNLETSVTTSEDAAPKMPPAGTHLPPWWKACAYWLALWRSATKHCRSWPLGS